MITPTSGKISGASSVVALSTGITGVTRAKWVGVQTGANSNVILIGGPEVTASVGFPIPANYAGQFFPPISELSELYDLTKIMVYVKSGDTLNFMVGG